MKFKTLKFIISIVICQAAGFFGSLFTTPKIATWYQGVTKPSFNPPNYLFSYGLDTPIYFNGNILIYYLDK